MAEIELRPIARADVRSQSKVLARAFYDDPVMKYMLPDDKAQGQRAAPDVRDPDQEPFRFPRWFRGGKPRRGLSARPRCGTPPGQRKSSRWEELKMMPTLAWHFHSRAEQTKTLGKLMEEAHPEEPHWYLMVIGSDLTVRGKGFGQALMRSGIDRCDGERAPAYLEASEAALVPYYQRFGFEQIGEIDIPDGPTMIPMWRSPR